MMQGTVSVKALSKVPSILTFPCLRRVAVLDKKLTGLQSILNMPSTYPDEHNIVFE